MQTLMHIVFAFLAAALLLIVVVVVLAIQVIRMLAGTEEEVAEHPASEKGVGPTQSGNSQALE
jgi:hypothetical protein